MIYRRHTQKARTRTALRLSLHAVAGCAAPRRALRARLPTALRCAAPAARLALQAAARGAAPETLLACRVRFGRALAPCRAAGAAALRRAGASVHSDGGAAAPAAVPPPPPPGRRFVAPSAPGDGAMNVGYVLQLNGGFYYVGKTARELKTRLDEHRSGQHGSILC